MGIEPALEQHGHFKAQAASLCKILLAVLPSVKRDFEGFSLPPEAAVIGDPKPRPWMVRTSFQHAQALLALPSSEGNEFMELWRRLDRRVKKSDKWRNWHRTDPETRRVLDSDALRPLKMASLFAVATSNWGAVEFFARNAACGNDGDIEAANAWSVLGALLQNRHDILVVVGGPDYSEAVRRRATEVCAAAGMTGVWDLDIRTSRFFRVAPLERIDPPGSIIDLPAEFLDNIVFDDAQRRYRLRDEPLPRH